MPMPYQARCAGQTWIVLGVVECLGYAAVTNIFAYVGTRTYNPRAGVIPVQSGPFRAVDYV